MIKMKKKITEDLCKIDDYELFEGNIDQVIERLKNLKSKYSDEYTKLTIKSEGSYDCVDWSLIGERIETDKEYDNRLNKETNKKEINTKKKQERIDKLKEQLKKLEED